MKVFDIIAILQDQYNLDDDILYVTYDREKIATVADDLGIAINEDMIDNVIIYCEANYSYPTLDDIADSIKAVCEDYGYV